MTMSINIHLNPKSPDLQDKYCGVEGFPVFIKNPHPVKLTVKVTIFRLANHSFVPFYKF